MVATLCQARGLTALDVVHAGLGEGDVRALAAALPRLRSLAASSPAVSDAFLQSLEDVHPRVDAARARRRRPLPGALVGG